MSPYQYFLNCIINFKTKEMLLKVNGAVRAGHVFLIYMFVFSLCYQFRGVYSVHKTPGRPVHELPDCWR